MLLEWKLKKIRMEEQKRLDETNLHLYKSITIYIQNSYLGAIEKEEILQQIMDMILQAQIENKPVSLIIGQDYEEFCKSVIEEYSSDKSKTYGILNYIQKYLLGMILISTLMAILNGITSHPFNFGISINHFIIANLISLIIIPASKKESQKNAAIISLSQRLYMINRGLSKSGSYAFLFMLVISGLLRFVLGRVFGSEIFSYIITLYSSIPYIILTLMIIGAIEAYKGIYNKRQSNVHDRN